MQWKLFDKTTGAEILMGATVKNNRGEDCIVIGWTPPVGIASTSGRVTLRNGEVENEHMPSTINAEIRKDPEDAAEQVAEARV